MPCLFQNFYSVFVSDSRVWPSGKANRKKNMLHQKPTGCKIFFQLKAEDRNNYLLKEFVLEHTKRIFYYFLRNLHSSIAYSSYMVDVYISLSWQLLSDETRHGWVGGATRCLLHSGPSSDSPEASSLPLHRRE